MNNLSQNIGALTIKELEARRAALSEELRQIQVLIDVELEVETQIQEVVASVRNIKKSLQEHHPHAEQRFIGSVLAALNEQTFLSAQEKNNNGAVAAQTSALQKVVDSVGSAVGKLLAPVSDDAGSSRENITVLGSSEIELSKPSSEGVDQEAQKQLSALPYVEFITLTPKVGYLRRTHDGAILGAYLGGKNKTLLEVWARSICTEVLQNGGNCKYELRSGQRLKDAKYEIKFTGVSFSVLQSLTEIDTSKSPKFRSTEKGVEEQELGSKLIAAPSTEDESEATESIPLQVADRVRIKSDRHGEEFVNQIGIVSVPSKLGGVVNISGKLLYFHLEELDVVEHSSAARNPADDLAVSASVPLHLTDDAPPW